MATAISIPKKGQPNWNKAEIAKQVADVINAIAGMTVEPRSLGEIKAASSGYVLDLNRVREYIDERIAISVQETLERDLVNRLGIKAVCNSDGTLSVTLYAK